MFAMTFVNSVAVTCSWFGFHSLFLTSMSFKNLNLLYESEGQFLLSLSIKVVIHLSMRIFFKFIGSMVCIVF